MERRGFIARVLGCGAVAAYSALPKIEASVVDGFPEKPDYAWWRNAPPDMDKQLFGGSYPIFFEDSSLTITSFQGNYFASEFSKLQSKQK